MINDEVLEARMHADAVDERRVSTRIPVIGELMVRWFGLAGTTHRYRLVDRSEHGYRLYSSLPIPVGTTGTVSLILGTERADTPQDDPVVVAWFRRGDASGYDVGLRRLKP
jgi:hypothetical protein